MNADAYFAPDIGPLQIDPAEVYRYLGVRGERVPSSATRCLAAQAIDIGQDLLRPAAAYIWRSARYRGSRVEIEGGMALDTGNAIKGWADLERVAVCLSSIGPLLEDRVSRLFQEDEAPLAFALDAFGSAAVQAVGECVRGIICQEAAAEGMNVGMQGEPGIGQWSLGDQATLFSLAGGSSLGMRLTEDCMLIPRKSSGFVVPAGRHLKPPTSQSICQSCNLAGCAYRQRRL